MPRAGIRAALAARTLPPVDGEAWAGMGFGTQRCACCGSTIELGEATVETQVPAGLEAHARCFVIWAAESRALESPGRAG